jgi:hypothetical protein
MQNVRMISNWHCITNRLKGWVHNYIYIFFVLNPFNHVQTAFNTILSKHNPNKSFRSPTRPISESLITSFKVFKNNKVYSRKINLKFQEREKIHVIESDDQKRTRSVILERTIYLEMNKAEFWSVNSE